MPLTLSVAFAVLILVYILTRSQVRRTNHRVLHVRFSPEHFEDKETKRLIAKFRLGTLLSFLIATAIITLIHILDFSPYTLGLSYFVFTIYLLFSFAYVQAYQEQFLFLKRKKNWLYSETMRRDISISNPSRRQYGPAPSILWIIAFLSFLPLFYHLAKGGSEGSTILFTALFPLILMFLPIQYGRYIQFLEELSRQEGKDSAMYAKDLESRIGVLYLYFQISISILYAIFAIFLLPFREDFELSMLFVMILVFSGAVLMTYFLVSNIFYQGLEKKYFQLDSWVKRFGGNIDMQGRYRTAYLDPSQMKANVEKRNVEAGDTSRFDELRRENRFQSSSDSNANNANRRAEAMRNFTNAMAAAKQKNQRGQVSRNNNPSSTSSSASSSSSSSTSMQGHSPSQAKAWVPPQARIENENINADKKGPIGCSCITFFIVIFVVLQVLSFLISIMN